MCYILDMETIGYYLFMSEQEQKELPPIENRSTNEKDLRWECKPAQSDIGVEDLHNPKL